MLTEEDILDLKTYLSAYDEFCAQHECNQDCEIFQISEAQKISCFKAYCNKMKSV